MLMFSMKTWKRLWRGYMYSGVIAETSSLSLWIWQEDELLKILQDVQELAKQDPMHKKYLANYEIK